jgi:hypothetical protein
MEEQNGFIKEWAKTKEGFLPAASSSSSIQIRI